MKLSIAIIFSILCLLGYATRSYAKFITGVGYIQPDVYRIGNKISPLAFGLEVIPMIGYRGERLSILGPRVSYAFIKGPISFGLRINAVGDRYESEEIERRDTAINAGGYLRIFFLTLGYGADISGRYKGENFDARLGHRFKPFKNVMLSISVAREFLDSKFTRYYYGVEDDEVGRFIAYRPEKAENSIARAGLTLSLSDTHSLVGNYSRTFFDRQIYESPTVSQKAFSTVSVFWNVKL